METKTIIPPKKGISKQDLKRLQEQSNDISNQHYLENFKIVQNFVDFSHRKDKPMCNTLFSIYKKWHTDKTLTRYEFTELAHYHSGIDKGRINKEIHKDKNAELYYAGDVIGFCDKLKLELQHETHRTTREEKFNQAIDWLKNMYYNIDIKPNIRNSVCGGYVAEVEYDGQFMNAYGNTKESALHILKKDILMREYGMSDIDIDQYESMSEYLDKQLKENK